MHYPNPPVLKVRKNSKAFIVSSLLLLDTVSHFSVVCVSMKLCKQSNTVHIVHNYVCRYDLSRENFVLFHKTYKMT